MQLNLVEKDQVFYTLQGEGSLMGHPSVFIRLSGCNLSCKWMNADGSSTTCDTPYASIRPESQMVDIKEIVERVLKFDCDHVVITGGEPLLQKNINHLIYSLFEHEKHVTIETNGTQPYKGHANLLSISPKLSSSSNENAVDLSVLASLITKNNCQLKFVVNSESDIDEIKDIVKKLSELTVFDVNEWVWIMPQGITREAILSKSQWLFEVCKENKWRYTDRLHIAVYGDKRGV